MSIAFISSDRDICNECELMPKNELPLINRKIVSKQMTKPFVGSCQNAENNIIGISTEVNK